MSQPTEADRGEINGRPLDGSRAELSGIPTRFVRKQAKTYGTCRLAEGGEIAGRRIAIVEDVVTSGGQVVESARALREQGAVVETVVCVIDRQTGAAESLAHENLQLRPLFTASQLEEAIENDPLRCAARRR